MKKVQATRNRASAPVGHRGYRLGARWFVASTLLAAPCLAEPRPVDERVVMLRGATAVVPVTFADSREPFAAWPARLADGRLVGAEVFRLVAEPAPQGGSPLDRWLPPRAQCRALHNESVKLSVPPGLWVLVFEIPPDASGGVRIGGATWDITWLDPVDSAGDGEPEGGLPGLDQQARAALDEALALESCDPRSAWRAGLVSPGGVPEAVTSDPVVRAWLGQEQARWQGALTRLAALDAALEARVRGRLLRMVRFGPGVVAPAWPVGDEVASLLVALLGESDARARRAALGFLESTAGARAWVVDDAGLIDPTGRTPLSTLAIANLSDATMLARPLALGGGVIPVEPGTVATWTGAGEPPGPGRLPRIVIDGAGPAAEFDIGSVWFAVRPPGLTTPAFAEDWTMASWLKGAEVASDIARARVLRASPRVEVAGDSDEPGVVRRERVTPEHWVLYFEADSGEGSEARVWLGPRGRPTSIIRVTREGLIDDELVPGRAGEFGGRVTRSESGWAFVIDLPDVERLQIGIEHRSATGYRTAWPRAMFPWQPEPGRIGLDLTKWGE